MTVGVCRKEYDRPIVLAVAEDNLLDWLIGPKIDQNRETIDEKIVVLQWNREVASAIQMSAALLADDWRLSVK